MKVLLIQDVYNLGRAGDVKKVANGYGRNYLLPQGLAVLATAGALKQADRIRTKADIERAVINKEMSVIVDKIAGVRLYFPARAGETGKLYGSITPQMIIDSLQEQCGVEISRRQVDTQPIRSLGIHSVNIRLTIDLIPEITVGVYREGEAPETADLVGLVDADAEESMRIAETVMDEEQEEVVEESLLIAEAEMDEEQEEIVEESLLIAETEMDEEQEELIEESLPVAETVMDEEQEEIVEEALVEAEAVLDVESAELEDVGEDAQPENPEPEDEEGAPE
jgi:large subunit ribosomal protein L9